MVVFFYHDQLCYFPDYLYQCHFSVCLLVFLPSCISYMFLCLVHCLMFLSICSFKFSSRNFYFLVQGIWKDKLYTGLCFDGHHSDLRKECTVLASEYFLCNFYLQTIQLLYIHIVNLGMLHANGK